MNRGFTIGQVIMLPNDMSLTVRGLETNYKPWKTVEWQVIEVLPEEKRVRIVRLGRVRDDYLENIFKKLDFLKKQKNQIYQLKTGAENEKLRNN